jgi:alanyl-tRNA synthetase
VFTGYAEESSGARVIAIIKDGKQVPSANAGDKVEFITDKTPFYGESGGQAGDGGVAVVDGVEVEIFSAKKPLADMIVHEGKVVEGTLKENMELTLAIDAETRQATRCNHTATHLLHRALRETLGEHVKQSGSLVNSRRLRFDFSHFKAMDEKELADVELLVNDAIRKDLSVITHELSYDEAVSKGAIALFGEKYGDVVRLVEVESFSKELCGGTHVCRTGEIGFFKIISESSVAAGVRRIEAVTASGAVDHVHKQESILAEVAKLLKTKPDDLPRSVRKLLEDTSAMEKDLKKAKSSSAKSSGVDLLSKVKEICGIKVLAEKVEVADRDVLAELAEHYRDKIQSGVVLLAAEVGGKVVMIAAVSQDLVKLAHAGNLVKTASEVVGGKGGGRPDFAQGGGMDASKIRAALEKAVDSLKK